VTDYTTHRAEALAALHVLEDAAQEVELSPADHVALLLDVALVHATLAQAAVAAGPAELRRTVEQLEARVDRLVADLARATGLPEAYIRLSQTPPAPPLPAACPSCGATDPHEVRLPCSIGSVVDVFNAWHTAPRPAEG
jgi:hypothetical protein